MTSYNDIIRIERIRDQAEKLGFRLAHPDYGYRSDDAISLKPDGEAWPVYSRDADLFVGTLEDAEMWMNGLVWAKSYFKMLRVVTDQKIERKEQDYRNQRLANVLAGKKEEEENDDV